MSKKKVIFYAFVFILFGFLMCGIFSRKINFHVDELLTYNLSNGHGWFNPKDGITYEPSTEPFIKYMANDGSVNLEQVWRRQREDVHPPFYYLCVHLVCRAFPGSLSMWLGGCVNFVFQMISLFFVIKMLNLLIEDTKIKWIITLAYVCCAGVLSIATLLRMYCTVITWVTIVTYIHMSHKDRYTLMDCAALYVVSTLGALTHYYFIAYVVVISSVAGVFALIDKAYKELVKLVITMGLAGASAYLIFPAMIEHVFGSYRGEEAMENLKNSDFLSQLCSFFKILDTNLFGNLFIAFILLGVFVFFCKRVSRFEGRGRIIPHGMGRMYVYLVIPIVTFICIISKSARNNVDRYISPIYAVLFVCVITIVYRLIKWLVADSQKTARIFAIIIVLMTALGYIGAKWEYLYRDCEDKLNYATDNAMNRDALIIHSGAWRLTTSYEEIIKCKSATYYMATEYDAIEGIDEWLADRNDIVLFLAGIDEDTFIRDFENKNSEYELIKNNGSFGYGTTYYYSRKGSER